LAFVTVYAVSLKPRIKTITLDADGLLLLGTVSKVSSLRLFSYEELKKSPVKSLNNGPYGILEYRILLLKKKLHCASDHLLCKLNSANTHVQCRLFVNSKEKLTVLQI